MDPTEFGIVIDLNLLQPLNASSLMDLIEFESGPISIEINLFNSKADLTPNQSEFPATLSTWYLG